MFDAPFLRYILLPCVVIFYVCFVPAICRDRRRVLALARHTFVESIRQKVLLVPLLFMVVVIATSLFTAVFREHARPRIVASSCLWSLTVFGMVVAIVLSARGIPDEISYKTIYSVIAKPVRRSTYLAGKVFGFSAVCLVILLIMGTASLLLIRWVARGTPLEARRTVSKGRLSIRGTGVEVRDGRDWIVHEPGSTLKWQFEGLPELSREEVAIAKLNLKATPADPKSGPMPVLVEFKNADDHSRYQRIDDARESKGQRPKEVVADLPGWFVVKGSLDVIAVPENGKDVIADDPNAVSVTAAKKKYHATSVLRRPNSWATWRFSQVPVMDAQEKIRVRICLPVRSAEGKETIDARVRVNPRGALGPPVDAKLESNKPIEVETSDPLYASKLTVDATRTLDVAILPQNVGDAYQFMQGAVELQIQGEKLSADWVLAEGYGLLPTTQTYWLSRAISRTALWSFSELPVKSLPADKVTAEAHFRIGKTRSVDIHLTVVNPSSPDVREEVALHAVREDPYRVDAKPVQFSFPRKCIDAQGRVQMVITRDDPEAVFGLPYEDCVVLYARPGSFDLNFFTAIAVIFFQLVLITAISVASSTVMSWPVSILTSFFVFFCGYIIDVMRNAAEVLSPYGHHHHHGALPEPSALTTALNNVIEVVLGFLSYILPDFRKFEVAQDVINNRAISGISIGGAIAYSATYVALAFFVAYLLFRRREIE